MKIKQFLKFVAIIMFLMPINEATAQKPKARKHIVHKRHSKKEKKRSMAYIKYAKLPKWGHTIKTAPGKSLIIKHRSKKYFYHEGVFYYKKGRKCKVVKAPIGIRVDVLPISAYRFRIHNRSYFYYYGTFYVQSANNKYTTIEPPIGAKIDALPKGFKEVLHNGEEYYKLDGVFYKPVNDNNGKEFYEVVNL